MMLAIHTTESHLLS